MPFAHIFQKPLFIHDADDLAPWRPEKHGFSMLFNETFQCFSALGP